jgi:glyoxylase-like metal-dependent hydrolase (beta-lactamase superfamily II)
MSTFEILPDLYFIERGYLNANHFVYRAEQPILIDTGYLPDFAATEQLIGAVGVNLAEVSLIINTHSHCDHIGGNRLIQERSGCEIAMHRIGKYFSDTRDDWSIWRRYYHQAGDFFDCTTALEEGQVVQVGPYQFEVLYTPGHASDGIVLYHRKEKILISSDALWEADLPAITVRIEGSRALFHVLESLEKLKSLEVKRVYPGHGPPFRDIKTAIRRSEEKAQAYLYNPKKFGMALFKKMLIYALLMHNGKIETENFFEYLMSTNWFQETIDFYFDEDYERKYHTVMSEFFERGLVEERAGRLWTTVKP